MQAHPVPTPASTTSDLPSHHLLKLAHGTPIPRSDDAQRRGPSVLQPVRSYPRARVRHPDPAFGHTARSRVRTTHGSAGVGPAARAFPPSSSRTAPRSRFLDDTRRRRCRARSSHAPTLELARGTPIPRSDDTWQHGHWSRSPCIHTLELVHGTPIPSHARHPDPAFGRHMHTVARASVPQPALPPNLYNPGRQLLSLRVDERTLTAHPPARPRSIFCVRMTA
ncbi:hypothetical protein B0H14DRAFT_3587609 [Mycena olivaceomarginata]|nr:hypothetical protein B0H14DRAFT_3587609 [Mycena olivaceomarginata]